MRSRLLSTSLLLVLGCQPMPKGQEEPTYGHPIGAPPPSDTKVDAAQQDQMLFAAPAPIEATALAPLPPVGTASGTGGMDILGSDATLVPPPPLLPVAVVQSIVSMKPPKPSVATAVVVPPPVRTMPVPTVVPPDPPVACVGPPPDPEPPLDPTDVQQHAGHTLAQEVQEKIIAVDKVDAETLEILNKLRARKGLPPLTQEDIEKVDTNQSTPKPVGAAAPHPSKD